MDDPEGLEVSDAAEQGRRQALLGPDGEAPGDERVEDGAVGEPLLPRLTGAAAHRLRLGRQRAQDARDLGHVALADTHADAAPVRSLRLDPLVGEPGFEGAGGGG